MQPFTVSDDLQPLKSFASSQSVENVAGDFGHSNIRRHLHSVLEVSHDEIWGLLEEGSQAACWIAMQVNCHDDIDTESMAKEARRRCSQSGGGRGRLDAQVLPSNRAADIQEQVVDVGDGRCEMLTTTRVPRGCIHIVVEVRARIEFRSGARRLPYNHRPRFAGETMTVEFVQCDARENGRTAYIAPALIVPENVSCGEVDEAQSQR